MKLLSFCLLALSPLAARETPILSLEHAAPEGKRYCLSAPDAIAIYATHLARRQLDTLKPETEMEILAMTEHGLHVRTQGSNGAISGWISARRALGDDEEKYQALQDFLTRQQRLEALVEQHQVALGMELRELCRVLGPPSSREIDADADSHSETVVWVKTETLDLGEAIPALNADPDSLTLSTETARTTIRLAGEVAVSASLSGGGKALPRLEKPCPPPFRLAAAVAKADR